jgi:hypothetical protein
MTDMIVIDHHDENTDKRDRRSRDILPIIIISFFFQLHLLTPTTNNMPCFVNVY